MPTDSCILTKSQVESLPWQDTDTPSSQIQKVAWLASDADRISALGDVDTDQLFVWFRSGKGPSIYRYFGVDKKQYEMLLHEPESPGRRLNASVKGVYEYQRITVVDDTDDQ